MRKRPRSSVTTTLANLVGRSVVSAITQTPASGPLGPLTTPLISAADAPMAKTTTLKPNIALLFMTPPLDSRVRQRQRAKLRKATLKWPRGHCGAMNFTGLFCAVLLSTRVIAQDFPAQPVRVVVPFPPGGGADALARLLGPKLADLWGQQVIVENKPGASGHIGADFVARSPADGCTLLMSSTASLTEI